MATKYWVGGDGNWSSATNWRTTSGGATITTPPGSADGAVLDANSGTSVVTVDSNITVQTLACTGFTGTLAFGTNTITVTGTSTVFSGSTAMTVTGTPLIILSNTATSGTRTINASAVTEANSISFNIINGSGTAVITITGGGAVRNLNFTGFTGSHNSTSYTMYGSLTLGTGMTVSAGSTTTFAATSGTKTITTNSVTIDKNLTFNGVGGTFQLVGALTSGATRTTTLTNGTLDLNGNNLTTGNFSSNNANVRTLNFDGNDLNGYLYLTAVGNSTIYNASNSTNFTAVGSGNVYVNGAATAGTTRTITPGLLSSGGSISNALSFYIEAGSDTISLGTNPCVFLNLQFNTFTGTLAADAAPAVYGGLRLSNGMTITGGNNAWTFPAGALNNLTILTSSVIDNPITFSGTTASISGTLTLGSTRALTLTNGTLAFTAGTTNTVGSFVTTGTTQKYLQSTVAGTQATISAASGTNTVTNLTIQDSNATGGAIWNAQSLTNVNAGNNTGWFLPPTPAVGNEITMRLRSFTQPRRF
jgi:hypothetical protein